MLLKNGSIGIIVSKNDIKIIMLFWKGIICFFTNLENHHPVDTAKAPINSATTTLLTPSQTAPPAATAAPAVQSGQCACTLSLRRGIKKINDKNNVNIFLDFILN